MSQAPELFEYIGFFEAEPEVVSPEVGWWYGAKFKSTRGADRIVAVIAPDEGEFSFTWWRDEKLCADLRMHGAVKWRLECNSATETLTLGFEQPVIKYFSLQLKPHITITWYTEWSHAA
jgi:hypothetical protein